jgi:hypothetical protein
MVTQRFLALFLNLMNLRVCLLTVTVVNDSVGTVFGMTWIDGGVMVTQKDVCVYCSIVLYRLDNKKPKIKY